MTSRATAERIDLDAIPHLKAKLDLTATKLTREEGFLLSRIDGRLSVDGLVKVSGLGAEEALRLIEDLCTRELVELRDQADSGAEPEDDFDPAELDESLDLPIDAQKRILRLVKHKAELSHYKLLDLDRRADAKEVKRAYFKVSKDFHPDNFFRKNIGPYKGKVVVLFKLISAAYEVLANEQKRRAYDATLPYEPTREEIEKDRLELKLRVRDGDLRQERRRRLLKRTPLAKRRTQARYHYDEAKEHREKKDPVKAANCIRMALALEPDNAEYQALLDEVAPRSAEIRAETEYKRGRYEESMGNEDGALTCYLAAIELNPDESRALHRAASLMLATRRDLKTALTFARKAAQLEPDSAEVVKTTADLYLELQMHKNALREYSRYLQLNPLDDRVQEKLKELRKMK